MTRVSESPKLKWIYKGVPSDPGYWESADGRFSISPEYRFDLLVKVAYGTARAQGYQLRDHSNKRSSSHDTVRQAKYSAERIADGRIG